MRGSGRRSSNQRPRAVFGSYGLAQEKLMRGLPLRSDHDRGRARELIVWHFEILWRRPLPDARRGVVHRPVARAEIAAVRTPVLAFGDAERHTAEVGTHAKRDQPV